MGAQTSVMSEVRLYFETGISALCSALNTNFATGGTTGNVMSNRGTNVLPFSRPPSHTTL